MHTITSYLCGPMLVDWNQIVQEIKAFAEITESYQNMINI